MSTDCKYNNRDLLQNFLNNSADNIYFKDLKSRLIMTNDAFARWVGYPNNEALIGLTDFDLFKDEHARPAYNAEQRIIETGTPMLGVEEKETWPDGRSTWVSTSKMPLRNGEGEIIGTFGVSRDITAHKEAELKVEKYTQRLKSINEHMEEDLRLAERFQHAFLPQSYPEMDQLAFKHYYQPGGRLGGDFCAIKKLDNNRVGLLICDVMGHGVRSALITGIIRAYSDELFSQPLGPSEFLSRLNDYMMPILHQSEDLIFVTACYVIADVSTGQLSYAHAGHPAPLCHRAASDTSVSLPQVPGNQPAIGLFSEFSYGSATDQLNPGDTLVLFTDGIIEAESEGHEEFGMDRLKSALTDYVHAPFDSLPQRLINEAASFQGAHDFSDDICLVLMQRSK